MDFEFGPPVLNLYQYVAEESHLLWTDAREVFILRLSGEPKKGLILFHDNETDLRELCWKQFEFDPHSTSFSAGNIALIIINFCVYFEGYIIFLRLNNQQLFLSFDLSIKTNVFFVIDDTLKTENWLHLYDFLSFFFQLSGRKSG